MSTNIGMALVVAGMVCWFGSIVRYGWPLTLASVAGDALVALGWAVQGDWIPTAVMTVVTIIALAGWWWLRKRRKRAPRELGAKSRARIAALVATLRENLRPRPVLRPQPGGAQAIRSLKSQ
jgi:integral membrane sensor domain MASE1